MTPSGSDASPDKTLHRPNGEWLRFPWLPLRPGGTHPGRKDHRAVRRACAPALQAGAGGAKWLLPAWNVRATVGRVGRDEEVRGEWAVWCGPLPLTSKLRTAGRPAPPLVQQQNRIGPSCHPVDLTGMPDHRLQGPAFFRAQKSTAYHDPAKNRFAAKLPELFSGRRGVGVN
jgi:hypothetical protein